MIFSNSFRLALLAGSCLAPSALATVTIDYVTVGDAGNAADPATGSLHGAVDYAYRIARNETTIAQYAEFLNAVATTDTYGLYHASMSSSFINGITQSGVSGGFTYTVNPGSGNKPITFVSWFDAARFTNWIHNGQPVGAQNSATTEDGAYTLNGAVTGVGISKNVGATVWIPSEDEWYKAAYYDPDKGGVGVGGYWTQATRSNTLSGNTVGAASAANFFDGDYVGSGSPTFPTVDALTDVGAYGANSASAYGTNDQAGNVWEWNSAVTGSSRGLRGGSWDSTIFNMPSSEVINTDPALAFDDVGFRLVTVPEPSSFLLVLCSVGALLSVRRVPVR